MATAIKKCRICGKFYEACHTMRHNTGGFRWQEVACSPECGSAYLAKIEESRRVKPVETAGVEDESTAENICIIEYIDDNDEDEELYNELDEYFDDAE